MQRMLCSGDEVEIVALLLVVLVLAIIAVGALHFTADLHGEVSVTARADLFVETREKRNHCLGREITSCLSLSVGFAVK